MFIKPICLRLFFFFLYIYIHTSLQIIQIHTVHTLENYLEKKSEI